MLESFFIPFSAIFFAELLDKSQLAVLFLGSKTRKHTKLLTGVLLAFAIVDGSAILFGSAISNLLPSIFIRTLSGVLFIVFGLITLRSSSEKPNEKSHIRNPFMSGFTFVFFAELGDKTQLASALFAARFQPLIVFLGVMAALLLLSVSAVIVGSRLLSKLDKQTVSRVSGAVFILLGILFFFT